MSVDPQAPTPATDGADGQADGPEPVAHLGIRASRALALSDAERIDYLRREHWIGYTRAKAILDDLDELLTHPPSHRMPCLLIIGETTAVCRIIENRPPSRNG